MKAIVTEFTTLVTDNHTIIELPDHLVWLIQDSSGNAVPFIKYLRVEYALGLKQAKDLYDGIRSAPVQRRA